MDYIPYLRKKNTMERMKFLGKYLKYILLVILIIFTLFLRLLKFNIIISLILSALFCALILVFIYLSFKKLAEKAGYVDKWHDLYGIKIQNIPYDTNNLIINTFKKDCINYKEEIGDVNNGKDYLKNERNVYDLYVPYSSLKRKDKYNGIILFIHGGGWIKGDKKHFEFLASRFAKYGYITAALNYTLLIEKYKEHNIFRILDEITACINSIKNKLKEEGFDENKLELAIGGASAGGHLSLLYGYSIKNSPLPIKFIINIVGVVSLESERWFKLEENKEALDNIEPNDIENAIKEKKIKNMFEEDETLLLSVMNAFIGNKYNKNEINEILVNKKIKKDNEKYIKMQKIVQNAFPYKYVNSNTVPTLCIYGGIDSVVGVAQYSILKKLAEKYGNKIELVYMKNGGHLLEDFKTTDGVKAMREMHYQILCFAQTYFTLDKKN